MAIPKIIHLCWFGGNEPNRKIEACAASHSKLIDAGYTLYIWNEQTYNINASACVSRAYGNKKWSLVSNYVRLDVLRRFGGIYIDTDIEIVKSFDRLLHLNFFIGFMWDCTLGTAVIGASPGHKILEDLQAMHDADYSTLISPNNNTFTDYFLTKIPGFVLNGKSQILGQVAVLPKNYFEHPSLFSRRNFTVHHFSQSWKNAPKTKQFIKNLVIRTLSLYVYRKYVCWRSKRISDYYCIYIKHSKMNYLAYNPETATPAYSVPLAAGAPARPIRVFVHLATDKDAAAWHKAWQAHTLVGINDETPYGYGRALRMGCEINFSTTARESFVTRFLRLGLRVVTGFDLLHALRQRRALLEADVVWTHTESQYLAVAAVTALSPLRPKIVGQSIWLFDRWEQLNPIHRAAYRWLIQFVDVLTVHSTRNLAVAQSLFPDKRVMCIQFGIPSEKKIAPVSRSGRPLRILSIGNDRHRDWECLASALDGLPNASAVFLSGTAPRSLIKERRNLQITQARTNTELFNHFAEASVVCVALKPNRHASGITVIQEAVLAGVPVIATGTGGLEDYFGPDVVRYVQPNDPQALREALQEIAADPEGARDRAVRAQKHMTEAGIGAEAFVSRHVEITREMLGR